MAQATFWSDELAYYLRRLPPLPWQRYFWAGVLHPRLHKLSRWSLSGFALAFAWQWNGKLVLATGVGCACMLLTYQAQQWDWPTHWRRGQEWLKQWFRGINRWLVIAVGAGGYATLSTYLAATIWEQTDNHWLAAGTILEGVGTCGILAALLSLILIYQRHRHHDQFEQRLQWLSAPEPLQRMIAVQQLIHWAQQPQAERSERQRIAQYLRFMRQHESDPAIRTVIASYQTPTRPPQRIAPSPLRPPVHFQPQPAWEEECDP